MTSPSDPADSQLAQQPGAGGAEQRTGAGTGTQPGHDGDGAAPRHVPKTQPSPAEAWWREVPSAVGALVLASGAVVYGLLATA